MLKYLDFNCIITLCRGKQFRLWDWRGRRLWHGGENSCRRRVSAWRRARWRRGCKEPGVHTKVKAFLLGRNGLSTTFISGQGQTESYSWLFYLIRTHIHVSVTKITGVGLYVTVNPFYLCYSYASAGHHAAGPQYCADDTTTSLHRRRNAQVIAGVTVTQVPPAITGKRPPPQPMRLRLEMLRQSHNICLTHIYFVSWFSTLCFLAIYPHTFYQQQLKGRHSYILRSMERNYFAIW